MRTTVFIWSVVAGLGLGLLIAITALVLPQREVAPLVAQVPSPTLTLTLTPTPQPVVVSVTPSPTPTPLPVAAKQLVVPFTPQAPLAQWNDPVFQDGCEEASILMAMHWIRGTAFGGATEATAAIQAISDFQIEQYACPAASKEKLCGGEFRDRSAADTAQLIRDYFEYQNVTVQRDVTTADIQTALAAGKLVITPMDGRALGNPFFTAPGPERHMVVVTGYDPAIDEFITNDPGTRHGEGYRYDAQVFFTAIRDYPTGYHEPIVGIEKVMIVVEPAG